MRAARQQLGGQSGIALLTALLLLLLLSSMLVGFMLLVTSGQQQSGADNDYNRAFYGAEAGMEKITADLGTLFGNTYAPTGTQVDGVAKAVFAEASGSRWTRSRTSARVAWR